MSPADPQILLGSRPVGMIRVGWYRSEHSPTPEIGDAEALGRNIYPSIDPTIAAASTLPRPPCRRFGSARAR